MKKTMLVLFAVLLVVSASFAYAAPNADKHKYAGFDVTITHTGPGEGTFSIVGENSNGTIDVDGLFESVKDPETGVVSVHVVFAEGSVVVAADGTVYELGGEEFWYNADANAKRIIHTIINYLKTLLEG